MFDYGDSIIAELENISNDLDNLIDEYLTKLFFKNDLYSHGDIEILMNCQKIVA